MSRTYRRKNYEDTKGSSWDRKGRKTAGYYTEYDYSSYYKNMGEGYSWRDTLYIFRPMTKEEAVWRYLWDHGDNGPNDFTPSRRYRISRQKQNRSINKQEFIKWLKSNGEYDPIFEEQPRSHLWDWR